MRRFSRGCHACVTTNDLDDVQLQICMEAIILIGIQASGKSTFFRERFFDTHVRINLDMLRTRYRERLLMSACLAGKQPFVIDNTNPTREERARYIVPAQQGSFRIVGYFFEPDPRASAARNKARPECKRIPPAGLFGTLKRLERPEVGEGFDQLYRVEAREGGFKVIPSSYRAPRGEEHR